MKISLFRPTPAQKQISDLAARNNVIVTGRRVGKSESIASVYKRDGLVPLPLITPAIRNGLPIGIFSKEYKDMQALWDTIIDKYGRLILKKDATSHFIRFHGGGTIEFFSLLNEGRKEEGRGRKFARIIVEETQKISDDVLEYWWNNTARPALLDYRGDSFFIGNANGQNTFFHKLARRGAEEGQEDLPALEKKLVGWKTFRFTTYDNPFIATDEIDAARDELDPLSFLQEIMAQFVNYGGEIWCYAIKPPEIQARILVRGLRVQKNIPLVFSFDFNKRPMTAIAAQFPALAIADTAELARISALVKSGIRIIRQFKTDINTDASIYDTCRLIREWVYDVWGVKIGKWPERNYMCSLPFFITGDASGNVTDGRQVDPMTYYDIICAELGMAQVANVRILSSNPPHAESYVKVNSNFHNNPSFEIDRDGCPDLITDIFTVKSDKFRGIDKTDAKKSHLLDCLRYAIHNFA